MINEDDGQDELDEAEVADSTVRQSGLKSRRKLVNPVVFELIEPMVNVSDT